MKAFMKSFIKISRRSRGVPSRFPNLTSRRNLLSFGCCVVMLSACVVKPLYAVDTDLATTTSRAVPPNLIAKLASITIDEVSDVFAEHVRNHLIFLFGRGGGEPSDATYRLELNLKTSELATVAQNIGDRTDRTGRPSLAIVNATSNFKVYDKDEKILFAHSRSVATSFDRHRQEFATVRAENDAMIRAANELAEQIYLDLAQTLGNQAG